MKNRGFTLVEIVTTVAIIGVLSAIAVPNFMRIKMEVNMEMVKQHMRIAGEKLTEIMGVKKRFPAENEVNVPPIIGGCAGQAGEDELSLTATLSALNPEGYLYNYTTDAAGSTAMIRSDPRPGLFSFSGDKCFLWDPLNNVTDISCSRSTGLSFTNLGLMPGVMTAAAGFKNLLNILLADPNLDDYQKTEILTNTFQIAAYETNFKNGTLYLTNDTPAYNLLALNQSMDQATRQSLQYFLSEVSKNLETKGITMYVSDNITDPNPYSIPFVGFKMDKIPLSNAVQSVTGTTLTTYFNTSTANQGKPKMKFSF